MNLRFLFNQLRFLFQTLPQRRGVGSKCFIVVDAALLVRRCMRLSRAMRKPATGLKIDGQVCTVILLSHNRPQNMAVLVDAALRNDFVGRVTVSNSNRHVTIGDWIKSRDPRLRLIDETEPTQPGHRFVLAAREAGEYFISIDDDIFLTPRQIGTLFERLVLDDAVPHGVKGNQYVPQWANVCGSDEEVDVLLGVYAFTRRQVVGTIALADALGLAPLSGVRNGEDVLMSCAGSRRPRVHAVGRITECASNSLPGIALWKSVDNFFDQRVKLFERAREARAAMSDSPRSLAGAHA
jgi:hypothetical protein